MEGKARQAGTGFSGSCGLSITCSIARTRCRFPICRRKTLPKMRCCVRLGFAEASDIKNRRVTVSTSCHPQTVCSTTVRGWSRGVSTYVAVRSHGVGYELNNANSIVGFACTCAPPPYSHSHSHCLVRANDKNPEVSEITQGYPQVTACRHTFHIMWELAHLSFHHTYLDISSTNNHTACTSDSVCL
jgi:hypothetical protein